MMYEKNANCNLYYKTEGPWGFKNFYGSELKEMLRSF